MPVEHAAEDLPCLRFPDALRRAPGAARGGGPDLCIDRVPHLDEALAFRAASRAQVGESHTLARTGAGARKDGDRAGVQHAGGELLGDRAAHGALLPELPALLDRAGPVGADDGYVRGEVRAVVTADALEMRRLRSKQRVRREPRGGGQQDDNGRDKRQQQTPPPASGAQLADEMSSTALHLAARKVAIVWDLMVTHSGTALLCGASSNSSRRRARARDSRERTVPTGTSRATAASS